MEHFLFMKDYYHFILEKYEQSLYHIVDFNKLFYILENNKISSYKFSYISTTRSKNLNGYVGDSPTSIFKLELDGKLLSQDYETKPFTYVSRTNVSFDEEQEEQIQTNDIENAFKYVKKVILIKRNLEYLKDTNWFTTDGNYKGKSMNIPNLLKDIIEKLKKYNIELYVQENGNIKKDDEYIESIINNPIKIIYHGYAYYHKGQEKFYHDSFKINMFKDLWKPVDDKNPIINDLVVGYEYDDLWLLKEIDDNIQKTEIEKNYKLFKFDFTYKLENIIDENEKYVHVKKVKLKNINIIK